MYEVNKGLQIKRKLAAKKKLTAQQRDFLARLEFCGYRIIYEKLWFKPFVIRSDGYIPKPYRIAIEIDGEYHNDPEQIRKDKHRDKCLFEHRRTRTIRVKNSDIDRDIDAALKETIRKIEYGELK